MMRVERNISVLPPRRRTLSSLIDLHESNYHRLLRLAPDLRYIEGTVVSRVAGALDLFLTVHKQQRYTTTLSLTYRFDDGSQPDAAIVVYHDVLAAELLSINRRRPAWVRNCRKGQMPEIDRKWRTNRFLQKWLGFCHRQGHLFLLATCHRLSGAHFAVPIRFHG